METVGDCGATTFVKAKKSSSCDMSPLSRSTIPTESRASSPCRRAVGTTNIPQTELRTTTNSAPEPGKTWGTKLATEERRLSDIICWQGLLDTVSYLWTRDWSQTVWSNAVYLSIYHYFAMVGAWRLAGGLVSWETAGWLVFCYYFSGLGVTAGMHRLWSHRSYKASTALEFVLACGASMSFQNSIYVWSRDHRVHHKYSETAADPHNSHRGLFFAHVGWLMVRKDPQVAEMGTTIDLSDLERNKIVAFQHRHYLWIMLLWTFLIPTIVPMLLWNESLWNAFCICNLRLAAVHHSTWLVNSISHWQGPHPYDNQIWPCENILTGVLALGEGWHNYHHAFPNDYRASDRDFGVFLPLLNFTQLALDTCARIGLCWDRITPARTLIEKTKQKYGDGSY